VRKKGYHENKSIKWYLAWDTRQEFNENNKVFNIRRLMNNNKVHGNNLVVVRSLVDNDNSSKSRRTNFCCKKGVKSFSLWVMMSPIISYPKGSS
jgi:hypothetical protein